MIDTDTRQLKRNPDGTYRSGGGKIPCDHCGHTADCPIKPRATCSVFMPALPFQDETGLRKVANTVRVGVAWTTRLIPGQIIALYNAKTKVIFGHSRVVGLHAGPIDEMLAQHAHANHLMLDHTSEDAAATLHAWQRQNYGPRIIHEKTRITAIYLVRELGAIASPDFRGEEARRLAEGGTAGPGQDIRNGER